MHSGKIDFPIYSIAIAWLPTFGRMKIKTKSFGKKDKYAVKSDYIFSFYISDIVFSARLIQYLINLAKYG